MKSGSSAAFARFLCFCCERVSLQLDRLRKLGATPTRSFRAHRLRPFWYLLRLAPPSGSLSLWYLRQKLTNAVRLAACYQRAPFGHTGTHLDHLGVHVLHRDAKVLASRALLHDIISHPVDPLWLALPLQPVCTHDSVVRFAGNEPVGHAVPRQLGDLVRRLGRE